MMMADCSGDHQRKEGNFLKNWGSKVDSIGLKAARSFLLFSRKLKLCYSELADGSNQQAKCILVSDTGRKLICIISFSKG